MPTYEVIHDFEGMVMRCRPCALVAIARGDLVPFASTIEVETVELDGPEDYSPICDDCDITISTIAQVTGGVK